MTADAGRPVIADVLSGMQYSTNERAERLMGRRMTSDSEGAIVIINEPFELSYRCPLHPKAGEQLTWSEYRGFLWCALCDRDWPSALCVPLDREPDPDQPWRKLGPEAAIGVFLDTVRDAVSTGELLAHATTFAIPIVPTGHWLSELDDEILVKRRAGDNWTIGYRGMVLNDAGRLVHDAGSQGQTDDFMASTRRPFDRSWELAKSFALEALAALERTYAHLAPDAPAGASPDADVL